MTAHTDTCTAAREWLAAHRDSEAGADDVASGHLEACTACREWVDTFDQVSRQVRLRAPMPSGTLTAAVARIATEHPPRPRVNRGQVLLAAAAISGIAVLVLSAAGLVGHSHLGSTEGRQAEALSLSLIGGYALAAWRPARLAAGLLPVTAFAAAITLALSVVEVGTGAVAPVQELTHLPLLLGAVGAALATRATEPSPTGRTRHHGTTVPHAV